MPSQAACAAGSSASAAAPAQDWRSLLGDSRVLRGKPLAPGEDRMARDETCGASEAFSSRTMSEIGPLDCSIQQQPMEQLLVEAPGGGHVELPVPGATALSDDKAVAVSQPRPPTPTCLPASIPPPPPPTPPKAPWMDLVFFSEAIDDLALGAEAIWLPATIRLGKLNPKKKMFGWEVFQNPSTGGF